MEKITWGYVVQVFDDETGEFVSQEFVPSNTVIWACDNNGGVQPSCTPNYAHHFEMLQV
jgi:hypothetical protein